MNKILQTLTKLRNNLLVRTKKITRKNLDSFIKDSILELKNKDVDFISQSNKKIINIGSGGAIGELVSSLSSEVQAVMLSIDVDPKRKPDVIADICNLPFADGEFDCIVCAEVLEHVLYPHKAFSEMHRVLKNEGILVLSTRFIFPLHDRPGDFFRYTKYGLEKLAGEFREVNIKEQHTWLESFSVLTLRLIKEEHRWVTLLAAPIYIIGILINFIAGKLKQIAPSDYITSGYFLYAKK